MLYSTRRTVFAELLVELSNGEADPWQFLAEQELVPYDDQRSFETSPLEANVGSALELARRSPSAISAGVVRDATIYTTISKSIKPQVVKIL